MLADDEFTSSVGAMRGGSLSLPPKTSTWTTTQGKLSLDEVNRRARAMNPLPSQDGFRFLDDRWVKNHPNDPRADALYRDAQERSRLLAGKGAGLDFADIESLRS